MVNFNTGLIILFLLFSIGTSIAQEDNCTCCTVHYTEFDFWVGEWDVYDVNGKKVGENSIVMLEDNCILNEHWRGTAGSTGRSYNYFNASDSTWNQLWLDNNGGNLVLKGKAEPNKMILSSTLLKGKKIDWYYNRITWTNNDDGTVTQHWEILDKNNKVLGTVFKGLYKRK